jgi:dienelactone hydrolase
MYVALLAAISRQYDNSGLELIGFSGGATIAMLAAPQIPGLISIRTVAGNLDTAEFARIHKLPVMADATNPAAGTTLLETIPQIHFVGNSDSVVPPSVANSYQAKLNSSRCIRVVALDSTHHQGWIAVWPAMLRHLPRCGTDSLPGPDIAPAA